MVSSEKKEFVSAGNRTKHAFDVVEMDSESTIGLLDSEERVLQDDPHFYGE